MTGKLIRRIKSPYLRQAASTGILLVLVLWLSNFKLIVEGKTLRDPIDISNVFVTVTVLAYLGFIVSVYFAKEKTLKRLDLYPYDFEESDEREKYITAKASRRSFYMMEFILGGGALFAMYGAAFGQRPELKLVGYTMAFIYIVMHLVYLAAYKREAK